MRRAGAARREILPDPKHGSRLVAKFVNMMMYGGKKSTAEQIFYGALETIEAKTGQPGMQVFRQALSSLAVSAGRRRARTLPQRKPMGDQARHRGATRVIRAEHLAQEDPQRHQR